MCIKMVNFNIIEGVDTFDGIKDEFLQMYLDGVKVNDIKARFGLTHAQYLNYLKRLRRSGEVKQVRAPWAGARKPPRQAPRNYTFNKNGKKKSKKRLIRNYLILYLQLKRAVVGVDGFLDTYCTDEILKEFDLE